MSDGSFINLTAVTGGGKSVDGGGRKSARTGFNLSSVVFSMTGTFIIGFFLSTGLDWSIASAFGTGFFVGGVLGFLSNQRAPDGRPLLIVIVHWARGRKTHQRTYLGLAEVYEEPREVYVEGVESLTTGAFDTARVSLPSPEV
jgi:hypothetical protein